MKNAKLNIQTIFLKISILLIFIIVFSVFDGYISFKRFDIQPTILYGMNYIFPILIAIIAGLLFGKNPTWTGSSIFLFFIVLFGAILYVELSTIIFDKLLDAAMLRASPNGDGVFPLPNTPEQEELMNRFTNDLGKNIWRFFLGPIYCLLVSTAVSLISKFINSAKQKKN